MVKSKEQLKVEHADEFMTEANIDQAIQMTEQILDIVPLTEEVAIIELIQSLNTFRKLKAEFEVTPKTFAEVAVQEWKRAQKDAVSPTQQVLNGQLLLSIKDYETEEVSQFAIHHKDTLSVQKQGDVTDTKFTADQIRKLSLVF